MRAESRSLAATIVALGACGCGESPPPDSPREPATPAAAAFFFTEVAAESGLAFVHQNGATGRFLLPEIMGGGGGFFDADGDGWLDVYLVQSGPLAAGAARPRNRLYRNDRRGRFEDVTDDAGVGGHGYGMGCAAGDVDNDGDIDLYVSNLGPDILYRNNGDGSFTDVTAASGTGESGWSTSSAFVDFDADGDLDLFVSNYVAWSDAPAFTGKECFASTGVRDYCSPLAYEAPSYATLYRNQGDGTFADVSESAGIHARPGTGLGVVCSDLDLDGRVDIYVANDQMPSFAWMNQGDGRFAEEAMVRSAAVDASGRPQAGMGVDAGDVENDGDFDLWKVHLYRETHVLYQNQGGVFDDATVRLGLAAPTRRFTGFGTAMVDLDLDGLLDIFVANGKVQRGDEPVIGQGVYAEPNQLLRQVRRGFFEDVTAGAGPALSLIENSRAAAFGDYDQDGDVDILVVNCGGPVRLLRNDTPRRGGFLSLRVLERCGRDAYGARVTCVMGEGRRVFEVRAARSYCATNDPRVHVGLGEARGVESVEVRWPEGATERFGPFAADSFATVRRGAGRPQAPKAWTPRGRSSQKGVYPVSHHPASRGGRGLREAITTAAADPRRRPRIDSKGCSPSAVHVCWTRHP